MPSKLVFICEHGAAKSVVAAAHLNRLARERNLDVRAIARGTHPDSKIAPEALRGLRQDGLTPGDERPERLSPSDLAGAVRVIAFCELPDEYGTAVPVERWIDVPPVSENYEQARKVIVRHVSELLDEWARGNGG